MKILGLLIVAGLFYLAFIISSCHPNTTGSNTDTYSDSDSSGGSSRDTLRARSIKKRKAVQLNADSSGGSSRDTLAVPQIKRNKSLKKN